MSMRITFALIAVAGVALLISALWNLRSNMPSTSITPPANSTYFVYAKIFDTVLPLERDAKYGDPLDELLQQRHLGEVTGGGTMQRKDKSIEYIGLDIELTNLDSALEATKIKLRELGVPAGSVLEFQRDGKNVVVPIHEP